jgi:rare lipoprotein A
MTKHSAITRVLAAAFATCMACTILARPALAAWTCTGPEFACKDNRAAKSAARKSLGKKAYKKAPARTARKSKPAKYSAGGSSGMASYYWQGTRTASGARFNPNGLTAAHRSLPFGTRVRVTNLNNGRSVTVTINDRGPFIKGRVIDLSRGAAQRIGMTGAGVARVSYAVVGRG